MKEMIQARKEQLQERGVKGFTLMEMLIVIAIIAVLVAIAIPVFTAQLNKANAETDAANIRSGYAVVAATAMTENVTSGKYWLNTDGTVTKADKAPDNAYKCKGASADAGTGATVAGQPCNWAKDTTVSYTISDTKITINLPK